MNEAIKKAIHSFLMTVMQQNEDDNILRGYTHSKK